MIIMILSFNSSNQKMLSFPGWLKPVRRHSATSIISGISQMELKADSSQNQSHRVYPPFHADPKEIFDYPKNKLTALDMIGMHENIPGNPNKPSKSAWGRVRKIIQNFMQKCKPL